MSLAAADWTLVGGARLRPLGATDAPAFLAVIQAHRGHLDRWLRWSGAITDLPAATEFLAGFERKLAAGDGAHLGLWVDGQLVGGVVCWYIHRQNRNAEVGYWLAADRTGRGLATEGSARMIEHLFAVEGLHRVEMQCGVDNLASRRIPERLGFTLEGIRRQSHWITDRFRDPAVYGLLAGAWRGRAP